MALRNLPEASNFKEIFVAQNNDSFMSFIFLVKSATYQPQSDEEVLLYLKQLDRDNFIQLEYLWVPAFAIEQSTSSVPQIEGLQLDKSDQSSFVNQAKQSCQIELFCLPDSDGTPKFVPEPAGNNLGLIEDSFVFVANQVSLDESLEMPLAMVHVDKNKHWKRI